MRSRQKVGDAHLARPGRNYEVEGGAILRNCLGSRHVLGACAEVPRVEQLIKVVCEPKLTKFDRYYYDSYY